MKINSLDQARTFCFYLVTASSIQRFFFVWNERNHFLHMRLLNTVCGWDFVSDWRDNDYNFPTGRVIRVTESLIQELKQLRADFLQDKVYQEHKQSISRLYTTISSLEENDLFFVYRIVYTLPSQKLLFKVYTELFYTRRGRTKEEADNWYNDNAASFFGEYTLNFYEKYKQGELLREKRTCRFCGHKVPFTKFKDDAHVVPESIGGSKDLICYEECDNCNKEFGEGIEQNLVNWFDYRRSLYRVRRKRGGIPKAYGQNYVIEDNHISIFGVNPHEEKFKALGACTVTLQGIYRALCKIAVDLIESEHLSRLQTTIKWIRFGNPRSRCYPKIAQMDSLPYHKAPSVYIFTRTDGLDRDDAPLHFCILRLFDLAFLYVLPHVDGRMLFDDDYTQRIPVEALKVLGFDKDWIWESYDTIEERFPHVWLESSEQGMETSNSHLGPPIEKLRKEKKPEDWIDFPDPQISREDISSSAIKNVISYKSVGQDCLKYISGSILDTKIIIDHNGRVGPFVTMHVEYCDVRTNEKVLVYDASVSFVEGVTRGQIQNEGEVITVHYKLLFSLIDYALDEMCMQLLMQYPDIQFNRHSLAAHDAFDLSDTIRLFYMDGGSLKEL